MADPERHLRALAGTGEVDDGLSDLTHAVLVERARHYMNLCEGLTRDLQATEKDMRSLRASRDAYKGQVTRLMTPRAGVELVDSLLVYWKVRCHGPDARVGIATDGKRGDVVRATLKRLVDNDKDPGLASTDKAEHAKALECAEQRAADRIRSAVDGAAALPFRNKYGKRFPEPGPGLRRAVDLVYVLRDEPTMEMFEALHDGDERRLAYRAELHRRLTTRPMELQLLASYDPAYSEVLCRAIRWAQAQVQP